jgi:hypothetical protein
MERDGSRDHDVMDGNAGHANGVDDNEASSSTATHVDDRGVAGNGAEGSGDGHTAAGDGGEGGGGQTDVHERAREGIEHLQAAARELIAAARAALDVAEELVNDPDGMASLAGMVAGLGDLARRATGRGWPPGGGWPPAEGVHDTPDDERQAKVERIRVT